MSTKIKVFIVKIVFYIALAVAIYGFITPYMISSTADELVIGGIILLIAFTLGMVFQVTGTIKNFIKQKENENAKE